MTGPIGAVGGGKRAPSILSCLAQLSYSSSIHISAGAVSKMLKACMWIFDKCLQRLVRRMMLEVIFGVAIKCELAYVLW